MGHYQDLLKTYEARELVDWKRKQEAQQRYENAAKQAHKVRVAGRLLRDPVPCWEDLHVGSQRHLIADAENVANNPRITLAELTKMYQDRLIAWGDTDSPDLRAPDSICWNIEEMVLEDLKATFE
jgi:hypothetical protein